MGLNFNRFSTNSQRWKNAISTGNFYRIRICLIFLQILQFYALNTSKFDYLFFIHPVERLFCFAGRIFQQERATLTDNNFENQLLCFVNRNW